MGSKCIFWDPVTETQFTWKVNYENQKGPHRNRNVTYDSRAKSGNGVIGTEGDDIPLVLNLTGNIIHREQYLAFMDYFNKKNSFEYTDEEGFKYEVTMTKFEPEKKRCMYNMADATMRTHTYPYTMELRIFRVISGELEDLV